MKYNKDQQEVEKLNQRMQMHRQDFVRQQTSLKIKPFDWGDVNLGIRRVDTGVFKAAARAFNHIILVRATNVASLQYIGNKNIYPKPIDCKAKTADCDASIPFASRHIFSKTAGLVVDPTIVGPKAFKDGKYDKAMEAWNDFLKDKTPDEKKAKVYRRRGTSSGCYAVDMDINSEYYGCLMISRANDVERRIVDGQTIATNEGSYKFDDTATQANSAWRGANVWDNSTNDYKIRMQYIHGDYDLYALLDVDNTNESTVTEWMNGTKSFCSKNFPDIQDFINRGIGSPMIQHGDQFRYKHQDDKLYAFYPTGSAYVIKESGQSMHEIFATVYGVKA
jgi:hypothetical protein